MVPTGIELVHQNFQADNISFILFQPAVHT